MTEASLASDYSFWTTVSADDSYAVSLRNAFRIVYLTLTLPIFFGNFLVIAAILGSRKLRRGKNLCLLSLSFADLVVGIGIVVCYWKERPTGVLERNHCLSCLFFTTLGLCGSFGAVLVISVERFVKIVHPSKHAHIFTASRSILWIIFVWLYISVFVVIFLIWNNFSSDQNCVINIIAREAYTYVLYCHLGVLLLVNGVLYALILRKVIQHTKQIQDVRIYSKSKEMERRTHVTVLIVLGVLYVCWGPFFITSFIPQTSNDVLLASLLALAAVLVNSFINPIIYAWRNKDFREAFVAVLSCRKCIKKQPFSHTIHVASTTGSLGYSTQG